MSGLELILSAALCVACVPTQPQLPVGLIQLNPDGSVITDTLPPIDLPPDGDGVIEDVVETLEMIRAKQENLRELRTWINGRHLKIATLEDFPLSYTELLDNGTRIGHGVSFQIIDFLREKFNFSYEVVVPDQNIIGSKEDFERSLVELLNSSNADLAAAFVPLLSDPRHFIYYSTTTLDEGEWIMVMQRPSESATGSGLLAPFDYTVWILIFLSLLVVGPIIYLLIIIRNLLTGGTEQQPYSLGHCAWFVYGALMKQGSTLSPIADSTRLIFATWWIFITILTSFYTANLTAFLTLSKFTLPYNTVDDIYYKNKHFVSGRGSGVEYAIRNTNESLSMLNRMILNNYAVFSQDTNDSFNLINYVEKNGFVFVRDRPAINHVLYLDYRYRKTISASDEKVHCPFAMAKEPFLKKKRSFAYPIGSKLSQLFDPELLNLVESGIIKHLSAQDLPNAEICPQDLGGTERQLRNGDLMMTYYIMLAGFATSMVVFSTELVFRYINGRQDTGGKWARHGVGRTPNGHSFAPSRWRLGRMTENSSGAGGSGSGNDKQRLTVAAEYENVTPPPPYQSIFSGSRNKNNKGGGNQNSDFSGGNNMQRWHRAGNFGAATAGLGGGAGVLLGGATGENGVRRLINGRDYMVFRQPNGQNQLVPVRAPSATLFQYTYTE